MGKQALTVGAFGRTIAKILDELRGSESFDSLTKRVPGMTKWRILKTLRADTPMTVDELEALCVAFDVAPAQIAAQAEQRLLQPSRFTLAANAPDYPEGVGDEDEERMMSP